MKLNNRTVIKICIAAVALFFLFAAVRSKYVIPVIMYHHIMQSTPSDRLSVAPLTFEKQMVFLVRKNYKVLNLEQVASLIKNRKRPKTKSVAITFDDGYLDVYKNAYPVLKKYNIPATVFIIVDFVGLEGYMNWDQIQEMARNNITFGCHTLTHPWLPNLTDEEIKVEVIGSRNIIENRLLQKVDFIAYPQGGFDTRVVNIVKDAGYLGACATNPGKRFSSYDPFIIKRLRISQNSDNLLVFGFEINGYYTWIKEIKKREKNTGY